MVLKYVNYERIRNLSNFAVIKIVIICMIMFYLLGDFVPYYEGADSFLYGVTTTDLFRGSFGFTNDLLEQTGSWDFVPVQWSKTIYNTAIPIGDIGIYGFTSIFYFVGGYYGLFYLGPILTVLFLIIAERVATNLFGKHVGMITFILLSTDYIILRVGTELRNDNIFAIFFILGCFYLIKFFHDKKDKSLLLCSAFFATGTIIRLNGIIAFPLEIFLILGFFLFYTITNTKNESNDSSIVHVIKTVFSKIRKKDFIKKTFFLLFPWIIFFVFYMSYNQYYFGDPLTNYFNERPTTQDYKTDSITSILKFDSWRFQWLNHYSLGLLPDLLNNLIFKLFFPMYNENLGGNSLGSISFLILLLTILISLYYKVKRIEVIVFSLFILGTLFFYSTGFIHSTNLNLENYQPSLFSRDRYMIPALPLYIMIFGFFIYLIWKVFFKRILIPRGRICCRIFRNVLLSILAVFLIASLFYSTPVQGALNNGIQFNNPEWFIKRFPLDSEGLSKQNSIILEGKRYAVEYDAIPFFPYWGGWQKIIYEYDPQFIPQEPIKRLKQLMVEGYDVFTFMDSMWPVDSKYYRYLAEIHGLYLKKYSQTFCKMVQTNNLNLTNHINSEFDEDCYNDNALLITTSPVYREEGEYIEKNIQLIPPIKKDYTIRINNITEEIP